MSKRPWLATAFGLVLAAVSSLPAFAQVTPTVTLHGCLIPQDDGTVVFRAAGGTVGPAGAVHAVRGGQGRGELEVEGITCGAFLATQNDDGSWDYTFVTASGDGSGQVTIDQQSGEWTPPDRPERPFRNR